MVGATRPSQLRTGIHIQARFPSPASGHDGGNDSPHGDSNDDDPQAFMTCTKTFAIIMKPEAMPDRPHIVLPGDVTRATRGSPATRHISRLL